MVAGLSPLGAVLTSLYLAAGQEPAVSVVVIPDDGGQLAVREANGDGRLDLIQLEPTGFGYRYLRADRTYPADFDAYLPWPGDNLAWDVVDLDGDGSHEVVTLSSAGDVRSWVPGPGGEFGEGRLHLASRSYLPHGVNRMRFARDVDGDGRLDLVLPAAGQFRIHLQDDEGNFGEGFEIEYEADVDYRVGNAASLESTFGQTLRIPWFSMDDVDGDGRQDLVSTAEGRVDFHLARPELSPTPTWTLDLASLAESGAERDGWDLDDLFSNLDQGVKWRIEELDGEAPRDLVIQVGGTIKVYHGGSVRGVGPKADQVLRVSGNLLHLFLREVTGDELPDLQLLRGEKIGLGSMIQWLVLPGSLDFEFFTYANTAGEFSRTPTRRNTISLKIPRLFSLYEDAKEIEDEYERQERIKAERLDLDGDGAENDVVDLVEGELLFFRDNAPPVDERLASFQEGTLEALVEAYLLEDLDRLGDEETRTIDLGKIREWNFYPGAPLRAACQGREPVLRVEATGRGDDEEVTLRALDLDGNGSDDVVASTRLNGGDYLIQFVVLPPAE